METRRLGRTEHESTIAILGGAAYAICTPDEAEVSFHAALDRGVNHLDIAPQYGNAEVNIGPHIPAVRDRLFIGEKTMRRHPDGVRAQLEETLTRLQTGHVDLYQLHAVTGLDELETRVDAIEVILAARDEGLTRFVGITGHDLGAPAAHLEALRRWDLDTVMFPVYPRAWADPQYRADAEALLAHCAAHDVGVMAIKAGAWRPWGDRDLTATSWYEPLPDAGSMRDGVRFTLSTPGIHAFCTPGDLVAVERALDAAEAFEPLTDDGWAAVLERRSGDELIFPLAERARTQWG